MTMNKPISTKDVAPPKVTTGALPGSRKVYSSPQGHEHLRVPLREITLATGSGELPFRVYDSSGPYTDADAAIDVERGLPKLRAPWIASRAGAGKPVTQLELARAGIVSDEMVFIAHRENIGRAQAAEEASARLADGESFGACGFARAVLGKKRRQALARAFAPTGDDQTLALASQPLGVGGDGIEDVGALGLALGGEGAPLPAAERDDDGSFRLLGPLERIEHDRIASR